MDDLRPQPTQGWSANKERWKDRLRYSLAAIGVLSLVGVGLALVLPDPDGDSQAAYERCLERAAEKAQGAVAIFNTLRSAKCDKLKPQSRTAPVSFDDLVPHRQSPPAATNAAAFLDAPAAPATNVGPNR